MSKQAVGFYKVDKENIEDVAKQAVDDISRIQSEDEVLVGMNKPICVGTFDINSTEEDYAKADDLTCALHCLQRGESTEFIKELGISQKIIDEASVMKERAGW